MQYAIVGRIALSPKNHFLYNLKMKSSASIAVSDTQSNCTIITHNLIEVKTF